MKWLRASNPRSRDLLIIEPEPYERLFLECHRLDREPELLPAGDGKPPVSVWLGRVVNKTAAVVVRVDDEKWEGAPYYVGLAGQESLCAVEKEGGDELECAAAAALSPIADGGGKEVVRRLMELVMFPVLTESTPHERYILGYQAGN